MPNVSPNETLQFRIEDYLHQTLENYGVEEVDNRNLQEVFDELIAADRELRQAQKRVSSLKRLLTHSSSKS